MAKKTFVTDAIAKMPGTGPDYLAKKSFLKDSIAKMPDAQYLAGSIVWDKSFGRPAGQKMADGFNLILHFKQKVPGYIPGAQVIWEPVAPLPITSVWDAPADGDNYRVNFIHKAGPHMKDCKILAFHAKRAEWVEGRPLPHGWFRSFDPIEMLVNTSDGQYPLILDPFTIRAVPIIPMP